MRNHASYIIIWVVVTFTTIFVGQVLAEELFLNVDTVFVVTTIDPNFTLELRVDNQVKSMKLFIAEFSFDSNRLDTVSFTKGTFWDTTGYGTVFGSYLQNNDSTLRLEGLVLGGGISADGPGLLYTVGLKGISPGEVDLAFDYHILKDVGGIEIVTSVRGSKILIDMPPVPVNHVEPLIGSGINKFPGENFNLVWTSSSSIYPGESVHYKLEYSTSLVFDPLETTTINDLVDTFYTLYANDLPQEPTTYFWRVKTIGDLYGFESIGSPNPSTFNYTFGAVKPEDFDLLSPFDNTETDLTTNTSVLFDWEDAISVIPNDIIKYILYVGLQPSFPGTEVFKDSVIDISEIMVSHERLPYSSNIYWQVVAINTFGLKTWSSSMYSGVYFYRGDANGNSSVNVADITFFVNYLFGIPSGPAPFPDIAADANCSGEVNIGDLTFLINYLFGIPTGPVPYCP